MWPPNACPVIPGMGWTLGTGHRGRYHSGGETFKLHVNKVGRDPVTGVCSADSICLWQENQLIAEWEVVRGMSHTEGFGLSQHGSERGERQCLRSAVLESVSHAVQ